MKRSITDIVRRGFDNMAANWPALLIRIGGMLLMVILAMGAGLAAVVPVVMSAYQESRNSVSTEDPREFMESLLTGHWGLILSLFVGITVLLVVLTAAYAFFEAGVIRTYVDGERAVAALPHPVRQQFNVFSGERFFAGARVHWWAFFWIYNIAWSVAGLIIVVPMCCLIVLMILGKDSGPLLAMGCLGIVLTLLFCFIVAIVTGVISQKAIVVCAARDADAVESLREGWRQIRADLGRHVAVAVIMMAISIGVSGFFSSLSMGTNFTFSHGGTADLTQLMFAPVRIVMFILSTAAGTAIAGWYSASFAALTLEPK